MPNFQYRALSQSGAVLYGTVEALNEKEAVEKIQALGHYPIEATPSGSFTWWNFAALRPGGDRKPGLHDLTRLTQELATLLEAGLALDRALEILSSLEDAARMRQSVLDISLRIRGGMSLADALSTDGAFPGYYVSLVRAGETGGNLAPTLAQLGAWLERMDSTRQAVRSALVYPSILLATTVLSVLLILVFVLPEFEPLFLSAGASLPLPTRIVMMAGDFIGSFWWAMVILAVIASLVFKRSLERPAFRLQWDGFKLRLPVLGKLLLEADLERFARTLGTLLRNGVTLPAALAVTRETLSSTVIAQAVGTTQKHLREGGAFSSHLARTGVFPSLTLDLVKVGETTGQLDEMLLRQADIYERTLRQTVDRLLSLLVPALTLLLGVIVAGLIASILVAILSINDLAL